MATPRGCAASPGRRVSDHAGDVATRIADLLTARGYGMVGEVDLKNDQSRVVYSTNDGGVFVITVDKTDYHDERIEDPQERYTPWLKFRVEVDA
jgi:hypothetical protein